MGWKGSSTVEIIDAKNIKDISISIQKKLRKSFSENSAAFKLLSFEEEKIKKARENAATASDQQQGGQRGGEGGGDVDMMIVVIRVVVITTLKRQISAQTR